MRTLVTGGAGFIGSTLCRELLAQGHSVVAVDNLITGRYRNIEELLDHPAFIFLEVSAQVLPSLDVDAVFHLASPASPVGYGRYPIETLLANSEGTRRVLDVVRECGARFLLASTSEVYGEPLEHPQREAYWGNVDPIGPRSCYDEGKRFAEALTFWYGREYNIDQRIVRIFNCYGPRNAQDDGRVVPAFISQALRNEPITVFGDGTQTRSFCYVDDMVRALMLAMFVPGTRDRVYNLGNPQERSVRQIAEIVRDVTGSSSPIVHLEGREAEITRRCPDIERARRELGWTPEVDIRDGLQATAGWYRAEMLRPVEAV